jgi:hypothetical protein
LFFLAKEREHERIDKEQRYAKKESLHKRAHHKPRDDLRREHDQKRIDDERKEPECEDRKRKGEKYENGPQNGIEYTKYNGEHERAEKIRYFNARNNVRRDEYSKRTHKKMNENLHIMKYIITKPILQCTKTAEPSPHSPKRLRQTSRADPPVNTWLSRQFERLYSFNFPLLFLARLLNTS